MCGGSLKLAMEQSARAFERHVDFEACIRSHYSILLESYSKRPFFYKTALKFSRLMVSYTLLSTYFSKPVPLLSEVKAFCVTRGFCSRNSLESIFLLFRALGFMTVSRHPDDSRLRVFSPSSQACEEIRRMLTSVVEPLGVMCSETAVCGSMGGLDDRAYLARYFKGFSVLFSHNVTIDLLMPDCYWLVKRDAGHMLMLAIYNDACALDNQGASFRSSSYLSIAEQLSVSKTHVIRLVQEGADRGYFKIHSKTLLEVLPPFMVLVRRFMAYSFATCLHSLQLSHADSTPATHAQGVTGCRLM
ncbi:hypothetical protein JBO08_22590 [Pseudomonas sp. LAP_36]|uniref:Uncharacterized protein n=2 Tax=Pseudomonas TaxID=286 RepID=A0A8H9Z1U2_9PSED|nr:hypothetical protein [Pseudomonas sp. SWRI144]MBW8129857.1 hypothetical protein [Pseudomonas sp. LAP_36]MBW8138912.1 hypothetical protein [Pseudomonas sp. PAMC 26818]QXH86138.1 hypothetical protein HU722_0011865 [Pseudomonas tritici]CRM58252.1 hypothetical protein [Pseudomonas sp. 58 R 12]